MQIELMEMKTPNIFTKPTRGQNFVVSISIHSNPGSMPITYTTT
jgi:hypothetical protein